ncbi:hypothetical protein RchiOBHm_Chr3g0472611 [Rosa chinensis]|uniref:Uncharacterized protein n=1 Tax=Rosa chinensis TaxID=74649 RepID=A0A2P6RBP2_ROSCH|nr:hypothetical protein RchiOBHm_Chr3g0472611 [Rosa chinensis]
MQRRLQERRCGSRRASIYMVNFSSVVCIYRVPESLVGISPKAIRPEKVSIGPYHHSKSKESEETKMKYFEAFLSRKKRDGSAGPDLSTLFKAARNMEAEARRCYDDQAIAMSSAEFVAMMVLDGCFIIELFLQDQEDKLKDVKEKDRLVMDLLKLENQLPFFVLERLFSLSGDSSAPGDSLALLALKFFNVYDHKVLDDVKHLLHLFHSSFRTPLLLERDNTRYQLSNIRSRCVDLLGEADDVMIAYVTTCLSIDSPATAMRLVGSILFFFVWWNVDNVQRFLHPTGQEHRPFSDSIQCATQLRPSEIIFKPLLAESFLTIDYHKRVLQIPPITINDITITIFINSIALEQCCPHKTGSLFTTYIAFMSSLINTPRDVALLSGNGIIITSFSHNDHSIADLLNKLGKTVYFDKDCYLSKQFRDVEAYYNSHWGTFLRTYFSAPWSFISVVSACILLLLAAAQTVVSILSYIKQMSDKGK